MSTAEKLLRDLVALPSVNPAFAPDGDQVAGERHVAEFVFAVAAQQGLDVALQEVLPQRPNVLAALSPLGRVQQRVLLAPHLDTVGGDPITPELFAPVRKHGRLHGRGACDTKGSVAAMLAALTQVAASGRRPRHTEIVFVGLIDEEHHQRGSRALAGNGFTADLAIVGEPTRCQVVTAHKGDVWLRLTTRGRAAHGSRPELGRNAVHTMARVVDVLETQYAARLRRRRHPLLGPATISVGTIQGGTQPNIVPAHCVLGVDRRTLPGETEASVRREVRAFLRRYGLTVAIDAPRGVPCPALETDPSHPLVHSLLRCVGQRRAAGVAFFCDAAVLAAGGTPSVVFGPGDIAQAHTADEWLSLRELERATRLLTRFLRLLP